jgi:LmbE family N-acetylglucosaminyl deacetylase
MDDLTKQIKGKKVFFVSPHLDDAVFSAGGLLMDLENKSDVTVVNVFTKADTQPYTLSAKRYLFYCGAKDAVTLFEKRKKEDAQVLSGQVKVINLDFVDAQWRKRKTNIFLKGLATFIPELVHTYPIYRLNIISGKVSEHDTSLITSLSDKLEQLIPKSSVVFCPVGFGNHVDHILVRDVCAKLFKHIYYWSDFPYDLKSQKSTFITSKLFKRVTNKVATAQKYTLMRRYKSQLQEVDKLPKQENEVFYYRKI